MSLFSRQQAKPADQLRAILVLALLVAAITGVFKLLTWLHPGVSESRAFVGRTEHALRQTLSEMLVTQSLQFEKESCTYSSRGENRLACRFPADLEPALSRALVTGGWSAPDKHWRYGRFVKGQIAATITCRHPDGPDLCFFSLAQIPQHAVAGDA